MNNNIKIAPVQDENDWSDANHKLRLLRATQNLRVSQSKRSVPWVAVMTAIFIFAFWEDGARNAILIWGALVVSAMLIRYFVAQFISKHIENAKLPDLNTFEKWLFSTSMLNGIVVGSGVWWIGLVSPDSMDVIYAAIIGSAIYAFGSMINASVQYKSFAPTVVANVGQGALYFSGLLENFPNEPTISASLLLIIFAQLGLGRVNANQFADSIKIRSENLRLVQQLSREKQLVEQALEQAKRANESKGNFLAAASHDLRQPLHALSLYLGSLALQVKDERGKKLLQRITDTTDVLREQFNTLLDLSRFDAKGIEVEWSTFRIDKLLNQLVGEIESDALKKGLTIRMESQPSVVSSDALLLERMIRNLIENAVRYTNEGGVFIKTETIGNNVRVTIMDTGVGISKEDQARVFEDFVQLHNRERKRSSGVGLGLAIVRRISETLTLNLSLESRAGDGTTFHFDLPTASMAHTDETDTIQEFTSDIGKGLKVWAVEDDMDVSEALKIQFESWGCDISLAVSSGELLRLHQEQGKWPDLVLLDDMLGDLETGLDIAKRLADVMDQNRIVLVTGNTQAARMKEIRESGFTVLQKPTQTDQLRRLLIAAK